MRPLGGKGALRRTSSSGLRTISRAPSATCAPGSAAISATSRRWRDEACSIFIASTMARRWPFSTRSPGCTKTAMSLPCIGAFTEPPSSMWSRSTAKGSCSATQGLAALTCGRIDALIRRTEPRSCQGSQSIPEPPGHYSRSTVRLVPSQPQGHGFALDTQRQTDLARAEDLKAVILSPWPARRHRRECGLPGDAFRLLLHEKPARRPRRPRRSAHVEPPRAQRCCGR